MEELIEEGKNLLGIKSNDALRQQYDAWSSKVRVFVENEGFSKKIKQDLMIKSYYTIFEYSEEESRKSIAKALNDTIIYLNELNQIKQNTIPEGTALLVVERILKNFYMYYHAMYRAPVHKRGYLTSEVINAIQIGNEYDLQRMLYSQLLPIFPTIRQETNSDNGYGGMRADIYLETYSLIIETKCTRSSMSEKRLLEELGADSFHYRTDI